MPEIPGSEGAKDFESFGYVLYGEAYVLPPNGSRLFIRTNAMAYRNEKDNSIER